DGKIAVNAENERKLLISDGVIAGKWEKNKGTISLSTDCELDEPARKKVERAKARYLGFLPLPS
ncbi:MAG: hypothetical protein LBS92_07485, partial [Candidatus Methanoplasma sp.]|nr:hypothetical protein [Candidatus Methanoplasma sp.]